MKKYDYYIPDKYLSKYDFLQYCKNVILDILKYADENKLSTTDIKFINESDYETFKQFTEDDNKEMAYDWLSQNGYKDRLIDYHKKHLFFSLIRDFYNFYSVSIDNIIKLNIPVAWSLLRRPLQETLAYIEWLAVNGTELIDLILNSSEAKEYDITNRKKYSEKIKDNISKLLGESHFQSNKINIYDFRYSKDDEISLNGILNGANHMVVNRSKSFKTSPSGFNFVYLDGEEFNKGLDFYYIALPYIMFYTINIIMRLFAEIADLNAYTIIMNGYNLLLKNYKSLNSMTFEEAMKNIDINAPIICTRCGKKMTKDKYFKKFSYDKVRCPRCLHSINTFSYIFEFEKVEVINSEDKTE